MKTDRMIKGMDAKAGQAEKRSSEWLKAERGRLAQAGMPVLP